MGIHSVGVLTAQRRTPTTLRSGEGTAAAGRNTASQAADGSASALESVVPTEVIMLYTAIIAGVTAVEEIGSYLPFRVVSYIGGIIATALTTGRAVRANMTPRASRCAVRPVELDVIRSIEFWTANIAFTAWGMVLPGSFVYAWLTGPALSLTIITVTAVATFLLSANAAPMLRHKVSHLRGGAEAVWKAPIGGTPGIDQ